MIEICAERRRHETPFAPVTFPLTWRVSDCPERDDPPEGAECGECGHETLFIGDAVDEAQAKEVTRLFPVASVAGTVPPVGEKRNCRMFVCLWCSRGVAVATRRA